MSASLLRSLIANWLGLALTIAIGFCISPYIVGQLGKEQYGVWSLIVSITAQSIIFDLGAKHAVVAFCVKYFPQGEEANLSRFLSSALVLFACCGMSAGLALVLFAPFFNSLFAVPAHLHFISQVAFLIAAIDAACDVFFGFFESSVSARERFDAINMLNVSRMCLYALLTFLALNSGFGLLGVASATFAAKTVQRLGLIWLCNKYYSTKQIKIRLVSPSYFKDLLAYGRWSGLQQAAYRLLYRADSILAGALFGPIAAAVYAIPVIIIDQIRSLAESSNGLLAPRFAALHAEGKNAEISKLLLKWSRYSAFLALAIGVSIWITGQDFLALWMGSDFAQSSVILKILVAPFILVLPGVVFTYYLYATAQHRIASLLFALEAVLALTSSYILAHRHGIEGIALGTLAPAIIIRGLYIPFYVCRKLSISMLQYISHSILCLLPLFLTYCVALSLTQSVFPGTSWMGFLVSNTISAALLCTGYLAFLTDKEERSYLKRRLKVR